MAQAHFVLVITATLLAGWVLSQALLGGAPAHLRLLGAVSGFAIVSIPLLMMLGIAQALHVPGMAVAACAALALSVVILVHELRSRTPNEPRPVPAGKDWHHSVTTGGGLGLLSAVAIPILQHHFFQPMVFYGDDLTYHATMPAHWLVWQGFSLAPYNYHAYFPANAELFTTLFVAPTRSDAFGALAGIYWLGLAAVAAYALARELGVSTPLALVAPALMLASPPFNKHASSFSSTDLAAGALTCAGAAFACALGRQHESPRQQTTRALYSGALLGLAAGSKITFIVPAAITFAYVLANLAFRSHKQWLKGACAFTVACALACGYWYVRNVALTGNPAFPAEVAFFEGPFDRAAQIKTALSTQLSLSEGPALRAALSSLFDWPAPIFGLVALGYAITLLGGAWRSLRRDPIPWPWLLIAVLGCALLYVVVTGPFSGTANTQGGELHIRLRFFVGIVLLGIVLGIYWLDRITDAKWLLVAGAMLYVSTLPTSPPYLLAGCSLLGGLAGFAWWKVRRQVLPKLLPQEGFWFWLPIPALGLACAFLLHTNFATREKMDRSERDGRMARWLAVETLPAKTKVAWITDFKTSQYYGMFGRHLQLDPVAINPDGTPYQHLHTHWRSSRPTWWARGLGSRIRPGRDFVRNLQQQGIGAILLISKSRRWGREYRLLKRSRDASLVAKERRSVLFTIAPSRQRAHEL